MSEYHKLLRGEMCVDPLAYLHAIWYKVRNHGPMSSIHGNQNAYCYLPGYTGATEPRSECNRIGAGEGEMGTGPRHGSR